MKFAEGVWILVFGVVALSSCATWATTTPNWCPALSWRYQSGPNRKLEIQQKGCEKISFLESHASNGQRHIVKDVTFPINTPIPYEVYDPQDYAIAKYVDLTLVISYYYHCGPHTKPHGCSRTTKYVETWEWDHSNSLDVTWVSYDKDNHKISFGHVDQWDKVKTSIH